MNELQKRHDAELNRLYDALATLEPGTEEYEKVEGQIKTAMEVRNEAKKVTDAEKAAKTDMKVKIALFAATTIAVPLIELACKRNLAKFIGKDIEQMEVFTSTPGRSISSWFHWNKR